MDELGWGFAAVKIFGLAIGVVAGGYMIWIACHKWKLDAIFWAGGAGLSSLGVVLIGLSMWKSVEVTLQVEEGLTLKLQAALEQLEANNRATSLLISLVQNENQRNLPGHGLRIDPVSEKEASQIRANLLAKLGEFCWPPGFWTEGMLVSDNTGPCSVTRRTESVFEGRSFLKYRSVPQD